MKKLAIILTLLMILTAVPTPARADSVDYSDDASWAYLESDPSNKDVDVFFICPTVFGGREGAYNMSLTNAGTLANFVGATNMEKGIYDGDARFFAPYYRQIGLNCYALGEEAAEPYLEIAYGDVADAFDWYMEHYNEGRPIILAGFSQGAQLAIRLIEDKFDDENLQNLLVACYAIGWRFTESETSEYPWLKPAQCEDDVGVVVAFNSEAEDVTDSMMIPEGVKTYAINPLNWKTDSTPADKSLNMGACFTNYDGGIDKELPNLTGAYIDPIRGALKVTDIEKEDYPSAIELFADGVYHIYDYQFFYRNLQQNVLTRINAYLQTNSEEKITNCEIVILARWLVGIGNLTEKTQWDQDKDGNIDNKDLVIMARSYIGIN